MNFIGKSRLRAKELAELDLEDVVNLEEFLDYKTTIHHLRSSDLLILFAQGQPLQIPGKFYDYLGVRKPIVIFTSDGATADLAKQVNCGFIVDSDDPLVIAACLHSLYLKFVSGSLCVERNEDLVSELMKPRLTQLLVQGI